MIILKRRPYTQSWSGNPVVYTFFLEEAVADLDIVLEVKLLFRSMMPGAQWKEVVSQIVTPVEGMASIDLQPLLDAELEWVVPDLAKVCTLAYQQTGMFYVQYRQYNNFTGVPGPFILTENETLRMVIKGGINKFQWNANNFWFNYYPDKKPFLTWQESGRLTSYEEPVFLTWLNLTGTSLVNIYMKITVTFTDKSQDEDGQMLSNSEDALGYNTVVHLATGALQNNLQNLAHGKRLWSWQVQLFDGELALTQPYVYVLDNRKDYNQRTLLYRSSLGSIDSVRIRGSIESNVTLEGVEMERAAPADWIYQDELPAFDSGTPHRETNVWKGDSGHLRKEQQQRLRDAYLQRQVHIIQFGRLLPIKLLTKQYKLGSSDDTLFSLPFEYTLADAGSYYYTPDIDLGPGALLDNVCRAIISIGEPSIVYLAGGVAEVSWPWTVESNGDPIAYIEVKFPGLRDEWIKVEDASPLKSRHMPRVDVIVQMRTVCTSGSYGAIAAKSVTVPYQSVPENPVNRGMLYYSAGEPTSFRILINEIEVRAGFFFSGAGSAPFDESTVSAFIRIKIKLGMAIVTEARLITDPDDPDSMVPGSISSDGVITFFANITGPYQIYLS